MFKMNEDGNEIFSKILPRGGRFQIIMGKLTVFFQDLEIWYY